jgi:ZIP family zinc transporter
VIQAFALGALAQSSLLFSGILPYFLAIPDRVVGVLAGAGAGALISAVAFDLVPEANALATIDTAAWLLAGAVIFVVADRLVERRFGAGGSGAALGIVLGAVVDGVPESVILGTQIASGLAISPAFFAAVLLSNVPQSLAPSAELRADGWPVGRMVAMWGSVVLACGAAAVIGYEVASSIGPGTDARAAAIASGGLLAMLTDSLVPFAYDKGGTAAGLATVIGFVAALAMG